MIKSAKKKNKKALVFKNGASIRFGPSGKKDKYRGSDFDNLFFWNESLKSGRVINHLNFKD